MAPPPLSRGCVLPRGPLGVLYHYSALGSKDKQNPRVPSAQCWSRVRTAQGGALGSGLTKGPSGYCPHLPFLPGMPVPAMLPLKSLLWVTSPSTGSSCWDPLHNSHKLSLLKRPPLLPKLYLPPSLQMAIAELPFCRREAEAPPLNIYFLSPYNVQALGRHLPISPQELPANRRQAVN